MARFFQPKKKTSLNTKHTEVKIENLDHHGCGIAYHNRKPVFIEGVLPGEVAVVQFTEEKSKYARAKKIKVLRASEQRETPFCPHYEECGGCDLQHLAHEAQLEHKQRTLSQLMHKFAGVQLPLQSAIHSESKGYRRRARISLLWNKKTQKLVFGFRQKQSKQIVDVTDCAVLEPALNQLLGPLQRLLSHFRQPASLGHAELVLAQQGPVLVLRHLKPLNDEDSRALARFSEEHQVTVYRMPEPNQLVQVTGDKPSYTETGCDIGFEPTNFIQVNQSVNHAMVKQALEWLALSKSDRVLDLFCGVGNFSLPLALHVERVVGIEGVDDMVEQARQNALRNELTNVEFFQANLEESLSDTSWGEEKFDKILLDPARAGAQGIVSQLGQFGASRIVYVSCNPATLARDSQVLIEQGYRLEKLGMLDMFPHTSHLESMALFIK